MFRSGELIEVVKLPLLTWQLLPDTEASKEKVQGEDPPVPFDEEGLKKTIREADEERRKKGEMRAAAEARVRQLRASGGGGAGGNLDVRPRGLGIQGATLNDMYKMD